MSATRPSWSHNRKKRVFQVSPSASSVPPKSNSTPPIRACAPEWAEAADEATARATWTSECPTASHEEDTGRFATVSTRAAFPGIASDRRACDLALATAVVLDRWHVSPPPDGQDHAAHRDRADHRLRRVDHRH